MNRHIFTSLAAIIAFSGIKAQNAPATPKVVINITIDQLRFDYVDAFSPLYGEKGFKRLLKSGRVYENATFDYACIDQSNATATIHTGASPSLHGIIGKLWFDRNTLRVINCVEDVHFMGYATSENSSAERLKVSTISDELMIASEGKAYAYSIAPTREMAVLMAGHASSGAFWLNDETGKWSGSTYYGSFPRWVSLYNDRQGLDFRIENIVWEPFLPANRYQYVTADNPATGFKYIFDNERRNKYRKFKTSPYVNNEVNKLVSQCLSENPIGKDLIPDYLSIGYYAGNYTHATASAMPLEIQDTYVRLDDALGELFDMIDKRLGMDNVLIVLTSTGYKEHESTDSEKYRIPTGEFSIKRCSALLNLYLAAIYGEGKFIEGIFDQEIYLSKKTIEDKHLDFFEVLNKSAEFLVQFSGVRDVYSSQRLKLGSWNLELEKIKNRYNPFCSGDLWIEVYPGWTIESVQNDEKHVVRDNCTNVPLIFLGWGVKAEKIYTPIEIGCLAATIAHCLRIRAPNAATAAPILNLK